MIPSPARFYRTVPFVLICLLVLIPATSARTIHVSPSGIPDGTGSSWETAFNTITEGLSASSSGDEIWILSATYSEAITMLEGVSLYGGFAGNETEREERDWGASETVLNATGLNSSVIICERIQAATLDGIKITGGSGDHGGGVYCDSSSPTMTNCIISGNSAKWSGGGFHCNSYSSPKLTNCVIVGNSAWTGGGVFCLHYSAPTLTNCTLADNWSSRAGSGIICWDYSSPILTNCLLWNKGKEIAEYEDSTITVQYCCIQGGWPGEGNIDGMPLFMDADSGDYHLREGSACIDRGLVSAAPAEDQEGNPRAESDGLVDMGAYESPDACQPGPASHTPTLYYVRADAPDGGDGASWTSAYPSITSALRVVGTSDELWVKAGTYSEAIALEDGVALYGGFIGNETTRDIRDWSANETTINATGLNRPVVIGADYAILNGFTLTGGSSIESGGGVYCTDKSSLFISNCIITGNKCSYAGGGLFCYGGSSVIITNCVISDNISNQEGGGFSSWYSSTHTLINCSITRNSALDCGGGLYCYNSSSSLKNCTIAENSAGEHGGGIHCYNSSPNLTNCTLINNRAREEGSGINCWQSSPALINCILWNRGREVTVDANSAPTIQYTCIQGGWPGEGNNDGDPLFMDLEGGDYHLCKDSTCVDRGLVSVAPAEDLEGNPRPGGDNLVDMGAYESPDAWLPGPENHIPTRWYVRAGASGSRDGTSWATALPSITSALNLSGTSDEIWVQAGIYPEAILLEPGVALYGGFSGNESTIDDRVFRMNITIIDATGFNRSVVIGADNATLDGFTITGGKSERGSGLYCHNSSPTLTRCTITCNSALRGGGIYCNSSLPSITNCSISGNTAMYSGGGVYSDENSSPVLTSCTITENSAWYGGGVVCNHHSSMLQCTVTNNSATYSGGGISCSGSSLTLTNCTISNNTALDGGGVIFPQYSSPTITNCVITGNSASGGGGGGVFCNVGSSPIFKKCTITNNSASTGGGVHCFDESSPIFINSVISSNSASEGGGLSCYVKSFPMIINCIFWENIGVEFDKGTNCFVKATYSCIKGGWPGVGNIDSNPMFVDAQNGNYHLRVGSPCIDAGSSTTSMYDACLPPGLGSVRNDMGVYGGPLNCDDVPEIPTPIPTLTPTPTMPHTPTPTYTPVPTLTPVPPKVWILEGRGQVFMLEKAEE